MQCKVCGECDGALFYVTNKTRCKKCCSKRVLDRLYSDPDAYTKQKNQSMRWQSNNVLRYRWNSAKARAKQSGNEFSLTFEEVVGLWEEQQGCCYYTGLQMLLDRDGRDMSVSLDRKDNNMGYSKDNTVLCVAYVNIMKRNHPLPEFLNTIRLVFKKHCDSDLLDNLE